MNLTKYISAIVVKTNATKSGRLTIEDALKLPLLDRYCILFNSRIFLIGRREVENLLINGITKDSVTYSQDLREFLFDYAVLPTEQEMEEKPNAIPYYPGRKGEDGFTLMQYTEELNSGKVIQFELMEWRKKESQMVQLSPSKLTRHSTLLLRNLKLKVDDKFEKVEKLLSILIKGYGRNSSVGKYSRPNLPWIYSNRKSRNWEYDRLPNYGCS